MRNRVVAAAALAAAALAATWVVEPNLLIGLRSPRALAWAAALAAVCALVGLSAYRVTRRAPVALAVAALPALVAVGLTVVRPILTTRRVDEALPGAGGSAGATPARTTATSATSAVSTTTASASGPETTSAAPVRVAAGTLRGLAGHDASGRVATYRLADGSYVVRFEEVDIGGTPSPHVYLVPGSDRRSKRGGVHLGELRAEEGSFHYAVPRDFAPEDFTVLVWCEQFAVEIANATQT